MTGVGVRTVGPRLVAGVGALQSRREPLVVPVESCKDGTEPVDEQAEFPVECCQLQQDMCVPCSVRVVVDAERVIGAGLELPIRTDTLKPLVEWEEVAMHARMAVAATALPTSSVSWRWFSARPASVSDQPLVPANSDHVTQPYAW